MNAVRRDSPGSGGDLPAALASLVLLLASLVLLLAVPASSALAQTVQGQLLDRQSAAAVEGALVVLLDEAGVTKAGYLTNEAGRFLLRAPGPGTYVLRGERIGYETVTSEPFYLSSSQTLNVRLETAESPILLEELRVEGRQRCVVRPGEGLEVARVWEEARKALTVQDWTVQQGGHHFQVAHWVRELDPRSRLVVSEARTVSRFLARNPVRSLPVEDLLEKGFVQPDGGDGYVYYGPDAAVLLSDPFLDSYCFRLRGDDRNPALVGLSFEPVQGRGPPGIQGTLWLDRETARLQFLQFTYTWAPWPEARNVAEGRVDFEELPGGAWIVRRWWIRMPQMELSSGLRPGGGSVLRVVGIREEGSEVIRITSLGRPAFPDAPAGTLSGQVRDSGGARPLAGATVFLAGTGHSAVTDSAGRYMMEGIPAGLHLAAFTHPILDSLGAFPSEVEVSVAGGRTTSLDLHAPSRQEVLEAHCGEGEGEPGASAVMGRVWSGVEGDPAPGAVVTLQWSRYRSPTGGIEQLQADIKRIEAVTDDGGRFRMCGIPPGVLVTA